MPGKHENDDASRKDASRKEEPKDEDKKENVLPPNIDLKTSDLNKLDDGDLQMVKGNTFVILRVVHDIHDRSLLLILWICLPYPLLYYYPAEGANISIGPIEGSNTGIR